MKLVALVAAWMGGLLLGLQANAYLPAVLLLSVAALALACLLKSRDRSLWPALLALVLLMGITNVELREGPDALKPFSAMPSVTASGVIVSDPEVSGPGVEFTMSVDAVDGGAGWEEAGGRVLVLARPPVELVQTRAEPYFRYGDEIQLTGKLEKPPALGNFDFRAYLANQGIHYLMRFPKEVRLTDTGGGNPAKRLIYEPIYDLRRDLSRGIDRALPEPQDSLAQELILGFRGRLPSDITGEFRSTGTSHLLAISGLHVGVILAMALGVGVWLMGRRRQLYLLLPLAAIWLYALLSGLSPSVERAAIMGSVLLLGLFFGRPRSILPALALTAAFMVGFDPPVLKQVSFQMSFTAVAGIALLTTFRRPPWEGVLESLPGNGIWTWLARVLVLALAVSAAATLATLPLVAFNFHHIPTFGIPATVLALPALPFLLLSSALAGVAGLVHPMAGEVLGWLAWVPLEYLIRLVHIFSRVPGSDLSTPPISGHFVWAYYGVFAVVLLFLTGRHAPLRWLASLLPRGREPIPPETDAPARLNFSPKLYLTLVVGLAVVASILWFHVATNPDGKLHVHFLDVGQGDSVLIVTPEGSSVLVDGGPGELGAAQGVGRNIPFVDRKLDLVVLTHPEEDHFRGLLEVLQRYEVGTVLEGEAVSDNPLYLEWRKAFDKDGGASGYRIRRPDNSPGPDYLAGGPEPFPRSYPRERFRHQQQRRGPEAGPRRGELPADGGYRG